MARGVIFFSLRATSGFRKNVLKVFGDFSFFFLFGRARSRKFDLFACFLVFFAYFSAFFAILVAAEKIRVWREVAINVPEILEIPEFLK